MGTNLQFLSAQCYVDYTPETGSLIVRAGGNPGIQLEYAELVTLRDFLNEFVKDK